MQKHIKKVRYTNNRKGCFAGQLQIWCPITTLLFVCISLLAANVSVAYAQGEDSLQADKRALWKADNLRDNRLYNKALKGYQRLYKMDESDPVIHLRLAEIYRLLNQPKASAKWYSLAVHDTTAKPINQFHYAQELCKNKKYILAQRYFESYRQAILAGYKHSEKVVDASNLPFLLSDSLTYVVERLPINSLGADFSPFPFRNGLLYVSTRGQDLTFDAIRKDHTDGAAYFDLYFSEIKGGVFSEAVKFHDNVNSHLHEGPLVIFDNSRKMIFTRNYSSKKRRKTNQRHAGKLRLYSMSLNEDGVPDWEHPKMLPFSHHGASYGHPATDGKVLYFASDMKGGAGQTDIYRTTFKDGRWSIPENMGSSINTEGYEGFPYLASDGMLYFASDGLGGMGGMDIYRIDPNSDEKPVNLGYPLNTRMDDFGIILDHPSGKSGYLSSNRTRGNHDDDIYRFYTIEDDSLYRVADSLSVISVPMDYISTHAPNGDVTGVIYQEKGSKTKKQRPDEDAPQRPSANTPRRLDKGN